MYQAQKPARSEFVRVRQLDYHVLQWGRPQPGVAPLLLLHGWMDVAASFQFMVDALTHERHVVAPDWRGFGQTGSGGVDAFWFPDYLADLDCLLDHYAGEQAVDLIGHSMGGNIAMIYAGVRPQRVRRLVNLEGFGLPAGQPEQAPQRYARWIDDLKGLHRGELAFKVYDSPEGVAKRLMRTNPRLGHDKAAWLAQHWAQLRAQADGRPLWQVRGEVGHKISSAKLYRVDEVLAIFRCIEAPVLAVQADGDSLSQWWDGQYTLHEYRQRLQAVPRLEVALIHEAGHMLHHDQPQALAALIERFLATA